MIAPSSVQSKYIVEFPKEKYPMKLSNLHDSNCFLIEKNDLEATDSLKPGAKKKTVTPFGKRMDASGVSGQNLAKSMAVHASTVSRLRHDVRNPGFDTIKKATKALGTDAEQLWPDIGA